MSPVKLPGVSELRTHLNGRFVLLPLDRPTDPVVSAELVGVYESGAVNSRYMSYAAQFALSAGVNLSQSLYAVRESDNGKNMGRAWLLSLTPLVPGADGRPRMEAVFHVPEPAVARLSRLWQWKRAGTQVR